MNLQDIPNNVLVALIGWMLKDQIHMKIRFSKIKKDLNAAHTAIRKLQKQKGEDKHESSLAQ